MDTSKKVNAMYQWVLSNMEFDAAPTNPSDLKGAFYSKKVTVDNAKDILNLMLATQGVDLGEVRIKKLSPSNLNNQQNKDLSYHLAVGVKFFKEDDTQYFLPQIEMKESAILTDEQLAELMNKNIIPSMQVANLNVGDKARISRHYQQYLLQKCKNNGKYVNEAEVKENELNDSKHL